MTPHPAHHSRLFSTPLSGVHGTSTCSGRSFARHWHATFGFGLLDDGAQTSASGRGTVQAYAGQVVTTNPGEVHDGRPLGGTTRSWRMVYLEPEALASAVAQPGGDAGADGLLISRPVIDDNRLRCAIVHLFDRLAAWQRLQQQPAVNGDDRAALLACDEAFSLACGQIVTRYSTQSENMHEGRSPVREARDCLADHCADPPTLAELAALVGLSRFQLVRRFAADFGMSPYAWLLLQRAERARAFIRAGRSLAAAAGESGFADQSHMTRTFVRHFGYTPGAWRRAMGQS